MHIVKHDVFKSGPGQILLNFLVCLVHVAYFAPGPEQSNYASGFEKNYTCMNKLPAANRALCEES